MCVHVHVYQCSEYSYMALGQCIPGIISMHVAMVQARLQEEWWYHYHCPSLHTDWQQQEILQILVWNLDPKELHYFTSLLKVRG